MAIIVTETAASEVKRVIAEQNLEKVYLRVKVVGGGCSGFSTKLDLDAEITDKDETFESNGANIVIDKRSLMYLENITIDYHTDLNQRGFVINNPDSKGSCGCGSSFSM